MTVPVSDTRLREQFQKALHDLNTPLSIIQNSLEPLESSPLSAEARAALGAIRREALRLMAVSEDLYLRLRAGEPAGAPESLDLAALLRDQIEILEEQHPARSVGSRVRVADCQVVGERSVLESLIWVVLCGVLLRTDGDVVVELAPGTGAGRIQLSVVDEGPALTDAQAADLLSDTPVAARRSRYHGPRSLELGLAAGQTLLRQHGGAVELARAAGARGDVNRVSLQLTLTREVVP